MVCRLVVVFLALFLTVSGLARPAGAQHEHGGVSDPHAPVLFDGIPNWGRNPTITAARSGPWGDAATWSPARVPAQTDTVLIPAGLTVSVTGVSTKPSGGGKISPASGVSVVAKTVVISGHLTFSPAFNTQLSATTVLVRPDGCLHLGTESAPIPAHLKTRLVLRGDTLTREEDPNQHGNGLLVLGRLTGFGAVKTSFVRLSAAPRAGDTVLRLAAPVSGWVAGDTIAVPDTRDSYRRQVVDRDTVSRTETAQIGSISSDGRSVTLRTAVRYDHPGSAPVSGEVPFLPHVLNLSRNVEITSASLTGRRAHVLAGERASVDVQAVAFTELGRTRIDALDAETNHIGRYALHFHHVTGPFTPLGEGGYRARIRSCAFNNSPKWQLVLHGTSKVQVTDNAFRGARGAAVVTEDGNERDNEFIGNIAVNCQGSGEKEPGLRADPKDFGSEGTGFWLSGSANIVKSNIAADCGLAGFLTFPHATGGLRYPMSPDADPAAYVPLQHPDMDFVFRKVPYEGNESYGTFHGFELWFSSPFTIRNNTAWNTHMGLVPRHVDQLIVDGFVVRGSATGAERPYEWDPSMGINNRYFPVCYFMYNLDIAGSDWGVKTQTSFGLKRNGTNTSDQVVDLFIERSRFRTSVGIFVDSDLHYKKWSLGASRTYIKDCRFEAPAPGAPFRSVQANLGFGNDQNMLIGDEIWIDNYQGRQGEAWRLFYDIQAPEVIVPHRSTYGGIGNLPAEVDYMTYWDGTRHFRVGGLEEEGLTNAQAWARYGKAVAGGVATTDNRHPEMVGFAQQVPAVAAPFPQAHDLTGYLDQVSGRHVLGWSYDRNNDRWHLPIDVFVDGKKVDTITANQHRPDMYRSIGYRWDFPLWLLDGQVHDIRLVVSGSTTPLPGYPIRVGTAVAP